MTVVTTIPSPVGPLTLIGTPIARGSVALTGLAMADQRHAPAIDPAWTEDAAPFAAAIGQLDEYFAGRRRTFDLPLAPSGTAFQEAVWMALRAIPYGATTTYGAIAAAIGRPAAGRAVGAAVGRNPIGIIVPCHRVVGAGGALTGYAGGMDRKVALLVREGVLPADRAAGANAATLIPPAR